MAKKILESCKRFIKENYKFFIVLILILAIFQIQLPYKIYTPGGMVNLSERISVEGGYTSEGELGMAYVSMVKGSIPFLLLSYIIPDWDIVPDSEITYDNQSFEETIKADQIATQQSIDSAIISAYKEAGKPVTVESENVNITYIESEADTDLELFDKVLQIDGREIKSTDELREIINSHQEGDTLSIKVLRGDEQKECYAKIYQSESGLKIGIAITVTYNYEEDPTASIKMKQSESGPSGGLMMSLAIYDALTEEDITKGKKIIGTGTIDVDGNVGEISGVKYKLIGAVHEKAEVFLVPKGNYEEAKQVKEEKGYDIELISVSTLKEAIEALAKI